MRKPTNRPAGRQDNVLDNYIVVIDGREFPVPLLPPGYGVEVGDTRVAVVRKDPASDRYRVIPPRG